MSVVVCTATSAVETKLLVCIEHADEFRVVERVSGPSVAS
jgi:hypothetical protein